MMPLKGILAVTCRHLPPLNIKLGRSFLTNYRYCSINKLNSAKMALSSSSSSVISTSSCESNHKKTMIKNEGECGGKTRLAIFDFDCTIVKYNTDDIVQNLLPCGPITKHEMQFIKTNGWNKFMDKVFRLLHEHKVTREQISQIICSIEQVPGMLRLIRTLHDKYDCEIIIISDANSVFINDWLAAHKMDEYFSKIFTNPAFFDKAGTLKIEPYHHQTDCKLSPPNMCKGKILEDYLAAHRKVCNMKYKQLFYFGDGDNDICPALRLKSTDIICAREGYSMSKLLKKYPDKYPIEGKLIIWKDGYNLLEEIKKSIC